MHRIRRAVLTGVLAALGLCSGRPDASFAQGRNFREAVLLRTEAIAVRRLESARQHLKAGQWEEAVPLLRQAADQHGDTWVPVGDGRYLPVQVCSEMLLSTLPAEALADYRKRIDPQARRWFEEATATRDEDLLTKLVRQAFVSSYGDDALWLLGELAFERGHISRARSFWSRLLPPPAPPMGDDWPLVAAYPDSRFDVAQVRARLVLCSIFDGDLLRAQRELVEFGDRHSDARGTLAGKNGILGQILAEALSEVRAGDRPGETSDTALFAGNPERNKVLPKTYELGGPLWSVSLKPYPESDDEVFRFDEEQYLPVYFPAVAGNIVVLCDEDSVYAFDLYGGEPAFPVDDVEPDADADPQASPELLKARIYQLPGELRAQGTGKPDIHGVPAFAPTIDHGRVYARLGSVTRKHDIDSKRSPRGYLVCLDLSKEGKHVGTVDSESIAYDGGGWTFEGAPVVAQDRVLISLRRHKPQPQVAVACFDASLQRQLWVRDVCLGSSNPGGDAVEFSHQMLSVSGDRVFFNTNIGAVAALDVADGSPLWLTAYERLDLSLADLKHRQRLGPNPCVIHGDSVFAAPYDSAHVLALDAASGRVRWKQLFRGEDLQLLGQRAPKPNCLLGVVDDRLIAAGHALWTLDVATGRSAVIGHEDPDPSKHVFGRGLLASGTVYTTSRDTLFVRDAVTGRSDRLPPQAPGAVNSLPQHGAPGGGNLVLAKGVLLVAHPEHLTAIGELATIRKRREDEVAQRDDDPRAHLELGLVSTSEDARQAFDRARELAGETDVWEGLALVDAIVRQQFDARFRAGQLLQRDKPLEAGRQFLAAAKAALKPDRRVRALQNAAVTFVRAERYPDAVTAWQAVLDEPELQAAHASLGTPAGLLAQRQISGLIQTHGRAVYASVESRAESRVQQAADDPVELEALFDQFPHAQAVSQARGALASQYLRQGQPALALRTARRAMTLASERSDRAQAVALAAEAAEQLRHWDTARELWGTLVREFPREAVTVAATEQTPESFVPRRLSAAEFQSAPAPVESSPFLSRVWTTQAAPPESTTALVPLGMLADSSCECVLLSASTLRGLGLSDGTQRWSHRANHRPDWSGFAGDWVLTGSGHELAAFDPVSGQQVWQQAVAGRSFRIEGRRILCQTEQGTLHAYSADDGRLLWRYEPSGQLQKHWQVAGGRVLLQTLLPARLLLVSSSEGSVVTVHPGTDSPWLADPVVLADNAFAVVTGPQEVQVFDAQSGSRRWREEVPGRPSYVPHRVLALGADLLVVRDGLTASRINPRDGREVWAANPRLSPTPVPNIETAACVDGQRLYVAVEGVLRSFDVATGQLAWEQIVGAPGSHWCVRRFGGSLLAWPEQNVASSALVVCEPATGTLIQKLALAPADNRAVHAMTRALVVASGDQLAALR